MSIHEKYFSVEGMHCAGCAARVDGSLSALPGVQEAVTDLSSATVFVAFDADKVSEESLISEIGKLGFHASMIGNEPLEEDRQKKQLLEAKRLQRDAFWAMGVSVCVMLAMHFTSHTWHLAWMWIGVGIVYGISARRFHKVAWKQLRRGTTSMDTLVSLSSTIALIALLYVRFTEGTSSSSLHIYMDAVIMIPSFVLLGKWLEMRATLKTSRSVVSWLQVMPMEAQVVRDGKVVRLPIDRVAVGDVVRVNKGDRIPTDGYIFEGSTDIEEKMLTGESMPVFRKVGEKVYSGSINLTHSVDIRVESVGKNTLLGAMIESIRKAQTTKPPIRRLADRVASVFVPVVLFLALVTFAVWYLLLDASVTEALSYAVSVLVIACPCALGLATPTALTVSLGYMARQGILVRNLAAVERLPKIRSILFDKTGTLTYGEPEVMGIQWQREGLDRELLLSLLVHAEHYSSHPLAKALVRHFQKETLVTLAPLSVEEHVGKGISFDYGDDRYRVGNASLMELSEDSLPKSDLPSVLYFSRNAELLATISLADSPLPEVHETLEWCHAKGYNTEMLTGDRKEEAQRMAQILGVMKFRAEQFPQDKEAVVKEYHKAGMLTLFVGDGVNDASAFSHAGVSMAMASGSDFSQSIADIVLAETDLSLLRKTLQMAQTTMRTVYGNFAWAMGYNLLAIPWAMGAGTLWGVPTITPAWGAMAMAFSSISVVINSLMLKRRLDRSIRS